MCGQIRDTATSHERLFFIEVMGRDAGFLALNGAIAAGAEAAIIPEISTEVDQLEELINNGFRKSKNSSIVLVAESPVTGGAMALAERVKTNIRNMRCACRFSDTCSEADRLLPTTASSHRAWARLPSTLSLRTSAT